MTVRPAEREHIHVRHKTPGLFGPVFNKAGGADDQRRLPGGLFVHTRQKKPCQRLQGLSQTHFIRQNTAKVVAFQEPQPIHTVFLVMPEHAVQTGGQRNRLQGCAAALQPGLLAPRGGRFDIHPIQRIEGGLDIGRI